MCGIAGIKRFGADPIQVDWVKTLLVSLQDRGLDATGLAFLNDNDPHLYWIKNDKPAWQFVADKDVLAYLDENFNETTRVVILHTRAATIGNPRVAANNHPMLHEDEICIVHNGSIFNHDHLFGELKMERYAETDSDVIRAILQKEGLSKAGIRRLERCTGAAAIAAIDPTHPDQLLLVRSGSPLVVAEYDNFLVWASEKHCIHKAMRNNVKKFGVDFTKPIPQGSVQTMPNDTAWLFNDKELTWHDKCKIAFNYTEPKRHVFERYQQRQKNWDVQNKSHASGAPIVIQPVPNPTGGKGYKVTRYRCENCHKLNRVDDSTCMIALEDLTCGHCKKPIKGRK